MKSNELRSGNYLLHNGITTKIYAEEILDIENKAEGSELFTPIPLTPEILEKCGFDMWADGHWKIRPSLITGGWTKEFYYYEPYKNLSIYTGSIILEYLHQLQNLYFALTGNELEINL